MPKESAIPLPWPEESKRRPGWETRATILGYMQRGGAPTCKDRVCLHHGFKAVELLAEGKTNRVVAYKHGEFVDLIFRKRLI